MEKTLVYELKRFYEVNKNYARIKKDDYDNLLLFFDSYYGGKAIDKEESKLLDNNMSDLLKDGDLFISDIVQGVKSYPNDKSKLCERLEKFLNHLKEKYKLDYNENLFENFKIKDKNERLLLMLKYLHSGAKTRSDIAEDFGISERTVADDIATLMNGFTFLGSEMEIKDLERGTNKYKSLIHPIFLALNSAEIYTLTVGLKLLSKDTLFEETLERIANVVYEQLSEKTKEMINLHKDDNVYFCNDPMKFINSRKLTQMHDSPYTYFLKEPIECIVTYIKDSKHEEYKGILKLVEPPQGNLYNQVILVNSKENIILDMNNIMSIHRADNEEYFKNN